MVGRSRISADSGVPGGASCVPGDRGEPEGDVGLLALRPDERGRLWLAPLQFGEYVGPGAPALGAVASELPAPPDVLGRVQVHGDVEARPGQPGVQRQQPLDDHELPGLDQDRPGQLPGRMVVDGLEDGTPEGQQLQVLLHHVHVVALGVEHGERDRPPFRPVVAVVVVDAECGGPV